MLRRRQGIAAALAAAERQGGRMPRPTGEHTVPNRSQWLLAQWLGALLVSLSMPPGPAAGYDWLQFGGDAQHSGNNLSELRLGPDTVNSLAQKYQVMLPAT